MKLRPIEIIVVILLCVLYIGGHDIYYRQSFTCDKTKNICFSKTAGFKSSKDFRLNELDSITIEIGSQTYHAHKKNYKIVDVYMPTLITKQGAKIPFYKDATRNPRKAEQDKIDFVNYMKTGGNKLELKNTDNFNWLF